MEAYFPPSVSFRFCAEVSCFESDETSDVFREVENIEDFLRVTAEKEADAKSRLQVVLEIVFVFV